MAKSTARTKSNTDRLQSFSLWGIVAGSIVLSFASLWFLLMVLPHRQVPNTVTEAQKRRADLINSNRENVFKGVQALAGLGFVLTAYLAWRNSQLVEDKNVAERFTKAVEMLADDSKLAVRLVERQS
ncbi:MAG: hypothetical protein AAF821_20000 [Cyanobacteria bacterium P01_D01_bin.156]